MLETKVDEGLGFYHSFYWKLLEGFIKDNDLNISFRTSFQLHFVGLTIEG